MKVNLFKSVKNTAPNLTRDVTFFLDRIRDGNSKKIVEELRTTEDEEKKKILKLQLPAVAFNGTFTKRSKNDLKEPSGLMILDFDDFDTFKDAVDFKTKLKEDKHIFSAWMSPNYGVKALYRIMDVKDDEHFKAVYGEVEKRYDNLDPSGKDISRLCFESYDPEIYVNLDAEVFSPEIVLKKKIDDIGIVTNIPIIDSDIIVNRLIKWFEREIFDPNNRNTSIYILASAFNKFGVDKQRAYEYAYRYAKSSAPEKEIKSAVDSAYKNTAEWNTKSFEDRKAKKKLKNMVASGKSDKAIIETFKEISAESIEQEIKSVRNSIDTEKFWDYDYKGDIKINPFSLKIFLESEGFSKHYPNGDSGGFVFIKQDDNFIDITSEFQIKDFVLQDLQKKFEIDVFNVVAEKTKLFTYQYLSILDTSNVDIVKDGKDFAMLYYQNVALKVTKDNIEEIAYQDLDGYVWRNNIIKRDYKDVDHHNSQFRSFVWYISGQDKERYNTFKSLIGYLLHSYKTSADNRAIVLNDEKISDNPNGGSGKGILTNAIGKMKNVSVLDGKTFDPNSSFPYQSVETDTQVLALDDVRKQFNFELLFSIITEGITLEYKGQDAIKIPIEDSPKVLISTNYTISSKGGSFERRLFEVELSSYFNANYTPIDEFGNMFFDEWDENEWNNFDKYMINCLQYYLENGLVKYDHVNLLLRKLINDTSQEFVDFMNSVNLSDKMRIDYNEYNNKFKSEYPDFEQARWFSQKLFNKWLASYLEYKGFSHESKVFNGQRYYVLKAETAEDKAMKFDNAEDDDDLPF